MVLFWGGRRVLPPPSPDLVERGPSAEDVLDERYALGEIDDEEYRQCRVTLREQRRHRRS